MASDGSGRSETVNVAKEKILQWDPQVVFMDINTLRAKGEASGLWQLSFDPVYAELSAVENGEIWSVLPYNSYTINYGSVLVNSVEEAADWVKQNAREGDLVITLGCGDIYKASKMMVAGNQ